LVFLRRILFIAALVLLLGIGADAHATAPGQNGRIAYERFAAGHRDVFTVNADGTDAQETIAGEYDSRRPAWSPDGRRIAFDRFVGGQLQVHSVLSDGSDLTQHTSDTTYGAISATWSPDGRRLAFILNGDIVVRDSESGVQTRVLDLPEEDAIAENPAWSPDGSKIAYERLESFFTCDADSECFSGFDRPDIWILDLRSGASVPLTSDDGSTEPSWSPDGARIAFERAGIWTMDAGGGNQVQIGPNAGYHAPAWSPDGTRIAYSSRPAAGPSDIYTMDATGGDIRQVTFDGAFKDEPDWQALPVDTPSTYAAPAAATLINAALVPAATPCVDPDRVHAAPLSFGSCSSPTIRSSTLTVGVGDGGPAPAKSIGSVQLKALGSGGEADDADLGIQLSLSNVMRKADLSDYTGELGLDLGLRLTDRQGPLAQTTQNFTVSAAVPCSATADTTLGGNCFLDTTAEALIPSAITEGASSVLALDPITVRDGGADEDADTPAADGVLATQGVFAP
jgi:hypothetical protein